MANWMKAWLLVTCVAVLGCGGAKSVAPDSFYPLRAGNAWSYDVHTGEPPSTLAVSRVEAVDGAIATVRTGQGSVQYEIRQDGIRVVSEGAWLFRAPLKEGAKWPARGGRTGRLGATDVSIETQAGSFTGCLEVIETGGKLELEVRTVYCPAVGPVAVDSTLRSSASDRAVSVHARLRGYDVSGGASLTP